jgi:hypothetical protein
MHNSNSDLRMWDMVRVVLKQQDGDELVTAGIAKIARYTTNYEDTLKALWEQFKLSPTRENARALVDAMNQAARDQWEVAIQDIVGVDRLTDAQRAVLTEELATNNNYLLSSLLPDLTRMFDDHGILNASSWAKFDHRVVFMYAGALWSLGFLATVMFDGAQLRDLTDLFMFAGPKDTTTCQGERGCEQYVNKVLTVADILARDIIPGRMNCLTSCRHMLFPVASPLGKEMWVPVEKGGSGSGNFGHSGRQGKVGGSGLATHTSGSAKILGKTADKWFEEQDAISEQWKQEMLVKYDATDPKPDISREALSGYLNRMGEHRNLILDEGMHIVTQRKPHFLMNPENQREYMRRLMVHDKDKYESISTAVAYTNFFKGEDRAAAYPAFKVAMEKHHDANEHHPEFWVSQGKPAQMPQMAFWEMQADWAGTARERKTLPWEYYDRFGRDMNLHPKTRRAVEFEFDEMYSEYRRDFKKRS